MQVDVAQRRGRLARWVVVCLLFGLAAGGVLFGPTLTAAVARGGGVLAAGKKRFDELRDYALFRSKGDKAVIRYLDPPRKNQGGGRVKHAPSP
jgi:hypothetical protein